jgi:hypothetical protein
MSNEQNTPTPTPSTSPTPESVKSYNPFLENVSEKPYTNLSVGVSEQQMNTPIPEPTFTPRAVNMGENPYENLGGDSPSSGGGGGGRSTPPPINPSMNDVNDSDKKLGAQHMAKLLVDGYEQLHVFANKSLQFNEKKLRKLVAEGEIDLGVQIPYELDKYISAGEFVQEFNEQNKDTLTVSREFKKEVTPVLTRVLEKRGASLTDEQYLGFLVGKDVVVKAFIVAQMRSTMNDVINVIKEYTIAVKTNGAPTPPPRPQQQAPTPPPPPQQTYQEPNHNASDFNFQDNEVVMSSSVQQMQVPSTGKQRVIEQIQKEKKWKEDAEQKSSGSAYDQAMKSRSSNGKRGRKPKDYVNNIPLDEEQIAEAIVLNETINQPRKKKDPFEGLD